MSFLTMPANGLFPPHRHEAEQIMVVLKGCLDEIIERKLYPVKEGDVIILPSNIEHDAQIHEVDCKAIDIFVPPRQDVPGKTPQNPGRASCTALGSNC